MDNSTISTSSSYPAMVSSLKISSYDKERQDKLEKTLLFWDLNFHIFMKPNIVIFTAIHQNTLFDIQPLDIIKHILSLNLLDHVTAYHKLSNNNYTYIEFSNSTYAANFQNNSTKIVDFYTHFIALEPPQKSVNITIDKIPTSFLQEYLPQLLNKWGEITSISPSFIALFNGKSCNSGSTKIVFKLNANSTIADIPYFIRIQHLKIYLHIPSRPKICFRCQSLDHLVSSCTLRHCPHCRSLQPSPHQCRLTYASKLMTHSSNWMNLLTKAQEDLHSEQLGLLYDQNKINSQIPPDMPLDLPNNTDISTSDLPINNKSMIDATPSLTPIQSNSSTSKYHLTPADEELGIIIPLTPQPATNQNKNQSDKAVIEQMESQPSQSTPKQSSSINKKKRKRKLKENHKPISTKIKASLRNSSISRSSTANSTNTDALNGIQSRSHTPSVSSCDSDSHSVSST